MTSIDVLICSGLDPSGRAGLLADLSAAHQLGARSTAVVTELTAQGGARFKVQPVAPAWLAAQLESALNGQAPRAIKLGAVPNARSLRFLLKTLGPLRVPCVIDPVTRTSKGERLSTLTPADYLRAAKRNVVLTPNERELEWLGESPEALLARGFGAVVVKGGDGATDRVYSRKGVATLRGQPLQRSALHHRGTGCRFGTALAISLGQGDDLETAARKAKQLVRKFLSRI